MRPVLAIADRPLVRPEPLPGTRRDRRTRAAGRNPGILSSPPHSVGARRRRRRAVRGRRRRSAVLRVVTGRAALRRGVNRGLSLLRHAVDKVRIVHRPHPQRSDQLLLRSLLNSATAFLT